MSDFVNTVDVVGDEELAHQIVAKTVTELKDDVVTSVRAYGLYQCADLVEVALPNVTSVGMYGFSQAGIVSADFPALKSMQRQAFESCPNLETANMPVLTEMPNFCFQTCAKLKTVSAPMLTSMGQSAFNGCSALEKADFPLVTSLGSSAFMSCASLKEVNLPLVTSIPENCFRDCAAFDGTGLDFSKITSVGQYGFQNCAAMTDVDFSSITTMGRNAFSNTGLTEAYLPNLTSADSHIFANCSALKKVAVAKLRSVPGNFCISCTQLEYADLQAATTIGAQAFNYCAKLMTVILRSETMCTLASSNCFANGGTTFVNSGGHVYVPAALVDTYKADSLWSTYADQFRALEDYTVDGTITGELDETKIAA